jgi:hypothetical protein
VDTLTKAQGALQTRLEAARRDGATATDISELRTAIIVASGFAVALYPDPTAGTSELLALGAAALAELDRRTAQANEAAGGASARELLNVATMKLKAIFGAEFVASLDLALPNATELRSSLAARAALLATTSGVDAHAPERFLQQAAQLRDGLRRWRSFRLYAEALRDARPRVDVLQLPFASGERWLGMPLPDPQADPPRGRVSYLALSYDDAPSFAGSVAGLLLDEWVELIPSLQQETGVAFHHDAPGAEAPQALLVVVPSSAPDPTAPTLGDRWKLEDLLATLNETMDLAKIRAVEPEQLNLGQLLPAILLAENLQNMTASTSLTRRSGPPVTPQGS